MAAKSFSQPVEESISKVNNEVEVGEDLDFSAQVVALREFCLGHLFLDHTARFMRSVRTQAGRQSGAAIGDGTIDVKYERIERTESPSLLTIRFGQSAIVDGKIKLFNSESHFTFSMSRGRTKLLEGRSVNRRQSVSRLARRGQAI